MRKKILIVGGGIAGLGAAYALKDVADLELWETRDRLGGHANTVDIDYDGVPIAVDTGFIVFNDGNYPNLLGFFDALGVDSFPSDMSFGFSSPTKTGGAGLEWSSNADGIFAQRRNLANPRFLAMLRDILHFNGRARKDLEAGALGDESLGAYLDRLGMGASFRSRYLLPMGAAIWSSTEAAMMAQPAATVVRFFDNHRLMHRVRRKWRTVKGGSRSYVQAVAARLGDRVKTGRRVTGLRRDADTVTVRTADGLTAQWDEVILACHSNQALAMLDDPSAEEQRLIGAIGYAPNRAVLHRDPVVRPKAAKAQAAWNYRTDPDGAPAQVTYDMNRLQGIDPAQPLYVTLNPNQALDPALVFSEHQYDHPQFDGPAIAAQQSFNAIQGAQHTWFAGAWLGYGFHEDGLRAGLRVARRLGGRVPWDFVEGDVTGGPWAPRPDLDERAPSAAPEAVDAA